MAKQMARNKENFSLFCFQERNGGKQHTEINTIKHTIFRPQKGLELH